MQYNLRRYFEFVPNAKKGCHIFPLSTKFEFLTLYSKQLTLDSGINVDPTFINLVSKIGKIFFFSWFANFCQIFHALSFFGNGTKVKISSEIKPPLVNSMKSNLRTILTPIWSSSHVAVANFEPCHHFCT